MFKTPDWILPAGIRSISSFITFKRSPSPHLNVACSCSCYSPPCLIGYIYYLMFPQSQCLPSWPSKVVTVSMSLLTLDAVFHFGFLCFCASSGALPWPSKVLNLYMALSEQNITLPFSQLTFLKQTITFELACQLRHPQSRTVSSQLKISYSKM